MHVGKWQRGSTSYGGARVVLGSAISASAQASEGCGRPRSGHHAGVRGYLTIQLAGRSQRSQLKRSLRRSPRYMGWLRSHVRRCPHSVQPAATDSRVSGARHVHKSFCLRSRPFLSTITHVLYIHQTCGFHGNVRNLDRGSLSGWEILLYLPRGHPKPSLLWGRSRLGGHLEGACSGIWVSSFKRRDDR